MLNKKSVKKDDFKPLKNR